MRNSKVFIVVATLLAGCVSAAANTETSRSYRQQLDIYKAMKIRLFQVAAPIKNAGLGECPKTSIDNGILTHRLSDYPNNMQAVAQSYWGLGADDIALSEHRLGNNSTCYAPVILSYEKQARAYTDGDNIFVTPALLSKVDNLSLALIIAHELGHIALGHVDMEPSEKLERQADRFALFLLARAELDFRAASLQEAAYKNPYLHESPAFTSAQKRAEHLRKVVTEIEALQAAGQVSGNDWSFNLRLQPKP